MAPTPITCRLAKLYDEAILSDQLGHAESVDGVRSRLRLPMLDVDLCAELHCQLVASCLRPAHWHSSHSCSVSSADGDRQSERIHSEWRQVFARLSQVVVVPQRQRRSLDRCAFVANSLEFDVDQLGHTGASCGAERLVDVGASGGRDDCGEH